MYNVEKRIQELDFENKSLKAKAVVVGGFSIAQFSMLALPSFQTNGLVIAGVVLIGIGTAVISGASAFMIKANNNLIEKYKQI